MIKRFEPFLTSLLFVVFVLFALGYSTGPLFEGPDEIEHYRYIQALYTQGALPDPFASQPGSQYHQAPLYYLIAAPLYGLFHSDAIPDDFAQIDGRFNPHYPHLISVPGSDNKNLYLHKQSESIARLEGQTARAVHGLRLLSVIMGLATVWTCRFIFGQLWPDRPELRVLALGLIVCWPKFAYMSGTLNNDNLLYLLSTLVLAGLLWLHLKRRLPFDSPLPVAKRRLGGEVLGWIFLGIVFGAALLTKLSAAFLIFPIGWTLLIQNQFRRRTILDGVVMGVGALIIGGWFYLRNWLLYADLTGLRAMYQNWPNETIRADGALALDIALGRLPYAYQTFWAGFGHGAVAVGSIVQTMFIGLTLAALFGLILLIVRRLSRVKHNPLSPSPHNPGQSAYGILIVFALSWFGALVYYAAVAWSGNQGRYLLPGVGAWAALIVYSLGWWWPGRARLILTIAGLGLLILIGGLCLFRYFLPAYQVQNAGLLPKRALSIQFGRSAELVGYSPAQPVGRPGDMIQITLHWRAFRPGDPAWRSFLHSIEPDVIKRTSYPGTGNLIASDWVAGQTWRETWQIVLPETIPAGRYTLIAGLYDPTTNQGVPIIDGDPTPVIGELIVVAR